jgi:hypothetical protein
MTTEPTPQAGECLSPLTCALRQLIMAAASARTANRKTDQERKSGTESISTAGLPRQKRQGRYHRSKGVALATFRPTPSWLICNYHPAPLVARAGGGAAPRGLCCCVRVTPRHMAGMLPLFTDLPDPMAELRRFGIDARLVWHAETDAENLERLAGWLEARPKEAHPAQRLLAQPAASGNRPLSPGHSLTPEAPRVVLVMRYARRWVGSGHDLPPGRFW